MYLNKTQSPWCVCRVLSNAYNLACERRVKPSKHRAVYHTQQPPTPCSPFIYVSHRTSLPVCSVTTQQEGPEVKLSSVYMHVLIMFVLMSSSLLPTVRSYAGLMGWKLLITHIGPIRIWLVCMMWAFNLLQDK